MNDLDYMAEAFKEAEAAQKRGECPVGAVLVQDNKIIARAGNREKELCDPTAHAEILAIREAGKILNRHIFPDCTVYTTLWPCPLCDAAMLQAQVPCVVSGARSFKWVPEVRFAKTNLTRLGPIMEKECREIFIQWAKENGREEILAEDA
ncbi:hypothetical protein BVX98_01435 [bacterium F11]|nr:hypothetical protein BVX98_01435 [bacterium F11]